MDFSRPIPGDRRPHRGGVKCLDASRAVGKPEDFDWSGRRCSRGRSGRWADRTRYDGRCRWRAPWGPGRRRHRLLPRSSGSDARGGAQAVAYDPAQGDLVRVDQVQATPNPVRVGGTMNLMTTYTILTPQPGQSLTVRETREIRHNRALVANPTTEFIRQSGSSRAHCCDDHGSTWRSALTGRHDDLRGSLGRQRDSRGGCHGCGRL